MFHLYEGFFAPIWEPWYYQITLVEKEQAFARADEPERKKESKKKLQKQKVVMPFSDLDLVLPDLIISAFKS